MSPAMTPEDARLAALAAALAPGQAAALLARGPEGAAREAARLAPLTRTARLEALALALPRTAPASWIRDGLRASASPALQERPRLAAALSELARGRMPEAIAPILVRLLRERLG